MSDLKRALVASFAFAMMLLSTGVAARADGELSATDWISSFKSPGQLYGPWTIQTLKYQWQVGNDIPSITLFNRNDKDRPVGSSSRAVYFDDYHTWSPKFFSYGQVSASSGTIQPTRMLYLEGDWKLGREKRLIAGLGGATMANPDSTSTHYLSVGPTYYGGGLMVYTVRFLPSDTNGIHTSATELSVEYNGIGHDQVVGEFLEGSQPSVLVGFPPQFATFQRLNEVDLTWNHWLSKRFGFTLGATVGNHYNRTTGATIYNQTAITVGLFVGHAVGLP